jgi:predicted regulator of Ras-like GTPase activity (Roadblock/LC7/MglB family)
MAGSDPANRSDALRQALNEYLTIPGMEAALLVSDQGLIISSAAHRGVDAAEIAALVIDTVASAQKFGLQVAAGYLDTMSIEFQRLTVVLAPFTQDVMLALVAAPGSLNMLRGTLGRGRGPGAAEPVGESQSKAGIPGADQEGDVERGQDDGVPSVPLREGA